MVAPFCRAKKLDIRHGIDHSQAFRYYSSKIGEALSSPGVRGKSHYNQVFPLTSSNDFKIFVSDTESSTFDGRCNVTNASTRREDRLAWLSVLPAAA